MHNILINFIIFTYHSSMMTDSFFLIKLVEPDINELNNVLNDNIITDDNFNLTSFYKPQIIELLSRPLFVELNFSVLGKNSNIANNDQDMMIFRSLKDAENARDVIWLPGSRNASIYAIKLIKKIDNTCSDESIIEIFTGYSQNTITYCSYLKYIHYFFTPVVVELNLNIIGKTFLGTNDICYNVTNYDYDIKHIRTFYTREMAESYLKFM